MSTKNFAKKKQWSVQEAEAILDYLHGDTPPDEAEACCNYEYARASKMFLTARGEYDRAYKHAVKLLRKEGREDNRATEMAVSMVMGNFPIFRDWRRCEILICPGYSKVPWRELREEQREDIKVYFVKIRPTPVITDPRILNAIGIFDHFKRQAEDMARECKNQVIRVGHYSAITGDGEIKHVVVTINYKEGKEAVKKSLSGWLGSEANEKLFKKYYKTPIHKQNPNSPVRYKELLKCLAAWRIYDELGLKEAKEWTKKYRRQSTERLRLRPFFREKRSKRLNVSPLYKERQQWDDAKAKAQSFLEKEIEMRPSGVT